MAWNYADQIHSLSGFDADTESASETGENFSVLAQQWLTDAAKEIINSLPPNLLKLCTTTQSFTSVEVAYPAVAFDATNILVFPDEAEYLVPIRASITAAEYLMAIEEDPETYGPVIMNLKDTYEDGMNILKTGSLSKGQQQVAQ